MVNLPYRSNKCKQYISHWSKVKIKCVLCPQQISNFKQFRWHCIVRSRCRGIFIVALMLLFHWCLALFSIVAALSIVLICKWHWLLWQMVTFCRYNAGKIVTGKTGQFNDDTKPFKFKQNLFFSANASSYSHYVFSTLDLDDTGVITFEVGKSIKIVLGNSSILFHQRVYDQFNDKTSYVWACGGG